MNDGSRSAVCILNASSISPSVHSQVNQNSPQIDEVLVDERASRVHLVSPHLIQVGVQQRQLLAEIDHYVGWHAVDWAENLTIQYTNIIIYFLNDYNFYFSYA